MSPFTPLPEPSSTRIRPRERDVRAAALGPGPRTLYVHPPLAFDRPWWSGPTAGIRRALTSTLSVAAHAAQHLPRRPGLRTLVVAARGELLPEHSHSLRRLACEAALGAAALLALNAVLMLVAHASGLALHPRLAPEQDHFVRSLSLGSLLLYGALLAPAAEELLFRWLPATLFVALRAPARWSWPTGAIVAAVFALAHVPGTDGGLPVGQFCGGLAFWWMQRRHGLLGAFAMHAAFNATVMTLSRL